MRLIFKKPIDEKIDEALNEATINGNEVEEIVLTRKELYELENIVKHPLKWSYCGYSHKDFYRGIPITKEEK
jgi:hypothetical protein